MKFQTTVLLAIVAICIAAWIGLAFKIGGDRTTHEKGEQYPEARKVASKISQQAGKDEGIYAVVLKRSLQYSEALGFRDEGELGKAEITLRRSPGGENWPKGKKIWEGVSGDLFVKCLCTPTGWTTVVQAYGNESNTLSVGGGTTFACAVGDGVHKAIMEELKK